MQENPLYEKIREFIDERDGEPFTSQDVADALDISFTYADFLMGDAWLRNRIDGLEVHQPAHTRNKRSLFTCKPRKKREETSSDADSVS